MEHKNYRYVWDVSRSQAAEQYRQMVEARAARAARRLRAHAGGLMPGSPSFDEGANDDELGTSVPPPS